MASSSPTLVLGPWPGYTAGFLRKDEDLLVQRLAQGFLAAAGEVRAAHGVVEEQVAGHDAVQFREIDGKAAGRVSGRSQHFTLDRTEGVRAFLQIFPFERRHRRETPSAAAAELGAEQGGIPGGAVDRSAGRFMQGRHAIQVIEVEMRAQDGPEREVLFLEQGEDFAEAAVQIPARIDGDGVRAADDDVALVSSGPVGNVSMGILKSPSL